MMAHLRAAALVLATAASALVIPTQPVLTRYAAGKVLEAAELKAKDEEWPVTICVFAQSYRSPSETVSMRRRSV